MRVARLRSEQKRDPYPVYICTLSRARLTAINYRFGRARGAMCLVACAPEPAPRRAQPNGTPEQQRGPGQLAAGEQFVLRTDNAKA